MMRRWFTLSILLLLMFALLISIAIGIGTITPPKPVLASFQPCDDTFCWLNINVQQTSPREATDILSEYDYTAQDDSIYFAPPENAFCDAVLVDSAFGAPVGISSIQLLNCPDLQFGDVANIFGEPQFVNLDCFDTWVLWYDDTIAILVTGDLTPRSPVFQVIFFNESAFDRPLAGIQWHGFLPKWRHIQLETRSC